MGECIPFPSEVNTDDAPLIPEGIYQLAYVYHSTFLFMGRQPKVAIFFRIVDPGDYFGIALTAYYNVIKFIGNRGKSGGFGSRRVRERFGTPARAARRGDLP